MPRLLLNDPDVEVGVKEVAAQLAAGQAGLYIGRGPAGFALICGSMGRAEVAHGVMVAVSLTPQGLRALRDRCQSLLDEQPASKVELVQ